VKVALVPPEVVRTVAASTLLVVRTPDTGSGLAHYLWYFLTSRLGRADLEGRVRRGMTIPTLSANALAEVTVPVPSASELRKFAALVGASDAAYRAALDAAQIRHQSVRDAVIDQIAVTAR
jgi:restriction endonuclease S subunit